MRRLKPVGEKPIANHQDVDIWLDVTSGKFWCTVENTQMESQALATLKQRLDDRARLAARVAVQDLQLLVLQRRGGKWDDDYEKWKWTRGTYAGMNAHTGAVMVKLANGTHVEFNEAAWFFRADDADGRSDVEGKLQVERAAKKEHQRAEKETDAALAKYAQQITMPSRWTRNREETKSEQAAAAEARFVEALTAKRDA